MEKSFDCTECIARYMKYEEDVVVGFVVQVFYFISDIEDIVDKDRSLSSIASKFGGSRTGQFGLHDGIRRDIDFYFPNLDKANAFRKEAEKQGYKFHDKYNRNGELLEYPSLTEITSVRNKLVEMNC